MAELDRGDAAPLSIDLATDPTPLVTLAGELDMSNIETLEAAVAPILRERPDRLTVDISALRFADSSGLALWLRWAGEITLELRGPSPLLRAVIDSMGLTDTLHISP
jgi:anti-anti-sigma factor